MADGHPEAHSAIDASVEAVIAETDAGGPIEAVKSTVADMREMAAREIALLRAIGEVVGAESKRVSLWGAVALVFAIVGLLTLAVALTLMLAALTGWLAAALIVPAALLAIAAIGGWKARAAALRLSEAMKAITS